MAGQYQLWYYLIHTLALNVLKILVVHSPVLRANPMASLLFLLPVSLVATVVAGAVLFGRSIDRSRCSVVSD